MADLVPASPCNGLLPVERDGVTLTEADLGALTSIAPFKGQQSAVSAQLQTDHKLSFPRPNDTSQAGNARCLWFGRDLALLVGVAPSERLAAYAALSDQSDAWASVYLEGAGAEDVLARLVPVDLRPTAFPLDCTCRTLLGHMNASITRVEEDRFLILVFRSMAQTLVDELHEAMAAVAARG